MIKKFLLVALGILVFFGVLSAVMGEEKDICEDNYVLLKMSYLNGEFSVLDKTVGEGCAPKLNPVSGVEYSYDLVNGEGILKEGTFHPGILFIDGLEGGEVVEVEENEIYLAVPYEKEVDDIEIYRGTDLKLKAGVFDVGATSCRVK
jgi:hypothetical protein